jgi:hypothetical protein
LTPSVSPSPPFRSAQVEAKPEYLQRKIISGQSAVARLASARARSLEVGEGRVYSTSEDMGEERRRRDRESLKDFDERFIQ